MLSSVDAQVTSSPLSFVGSMHAASGPSSAPASVARTRHLQHKRGPSGNKHAHKNV